MAGMSRKRLNLERALKVGDELGGHIVSGHVDGVAEIVAMRDEGDSTRFTFRAPEALAGFIAPKGSVALNGTSLTVNEVEGARVRRQHHPAHQDSDDLGRGKDRRPREPRDRHARALRRAASGLGGAVSGPGHNGGPTLEAGGSWRRHCWRVARAELLPKLPLEVVRLHVKRAGEIGLDYKTYAGVRATTGHDLVAFLFSTNALRLLREGDRMPAADAETLARTRHVGRLIAAQPPLDPARVRQGLAGQGVAIDAAARAPGIALGWAETRQALLDLLGEVRAPADRVLVIGETALERDWVGAARMAGFLPAARYFCGPTAASDR